MPSASVGFIYDSKLQVYVRTKYRVPTKCQNYYMPVIMENRGSWESSRKARHGGTSVIPAPGRLGQGLGGQAPSGLHSKPLTQETNTSPLGQGLCAGAIDETERIIQKVKTQYWMKHWTWTWCFKCWLQGRDLNHSRAGPGRRASLLWGEGSELRKGISPQFRDIAARVGAGAHKLPCPTPLANEQIVLHCTDKRGQCWSTCKPPRNGGGSQD